MDLMWKNRSGEAYTIMKSFYNLQKGNKRINLFIVFIIYSIKAYKFILYIQKIYT